MKKYSFFLLLLVLSFIMFPNSLSYSKEISSQKNNEYNYDSYDGIIYSLHSSPNNQFDNYATIEDYSNAKNVINGVFTVPYEIICNGITYPVAGVNTVNTPKHIKEVIIPKEFGTKKIQLPYYVNDFINGSYYFALPNVPKVTVYAENITIANQLYISYVARNEPWDSIWGYPTRITSNKSVLEEVNIYSKTARIQKYALTDYPNLGTLTFAEQTQLTLENWSIINLPKIKMLRLPAKSKYTEGAISFCYNLEQITFQGKSRYTVNPKNGSITSPSNTFPVCTI